MKPKILKKISKTVSHALRHDPEAYGLELDEEGWVEVEDLLVALRRRGGAWESLTEEHLQEVVARSDKQRFEIREGRIRALYGHSLPGTIARTPSVPPDVLFHGTSPDAGRRIREEGLKPMGRQYVHLSTDGATARQVGLRRSRAPVILGIDAKRAHEDGLLFFEGNDKVWLAGEIPPEYILPEPG